MADEAHSTPPAPAATEALSPAEISAKVEMLGVKKAHTPFGQEFLLAMVAGGSIGIGGMFFAIVLGDPELGYAAQRLLGGLVFSLGLALVMIAGAELFTGNCLLTMAWASGKLSTRDVLSNWAVVWVGNLIGALGLVFLLWMCHFPDLNGGNVGLGLLKLAVAKTSPDFVTIFFKGVMCNMLVCYGVWLAYAGRTVADKMAGMVLPVAAFVAAGFEHCIANMLFLPLAWMIAAFGHVPAGVDVSGITVAAIVHNLVPATLGNIAGGGVFIGLVYWLIYRRGVEAKPGRPIAERRAAAE